MQRLKILRPMYSAGFWSSSAVLPLLAALVYPNIPWAFLTWWAFCGTMLLLTSENKNVK